jgi:hypothetical protein
LPLYRIRQKRDVMAAMKGFHHIRELVACL